MNCCVMLTLKNEMTPVQPNDLHIHIILHCHRSTVSNEQKDMVRDDMVQMWP